MTQQAIPTEPNRLLEVDLDRIQFGLVESIARTNGVSPSTAVRMLLANAIHDLNERDRQAENEA